MCRSAVQECGKSFSDKQDTGEMRSAPSYFSLVCLVAYRAQKYLHSTFKDIFRKSSRSISFHLRIFRVWRHFQKCVDPFCSQSFPKLRRSTLRPTAGRFCSTALRVMASVVAPLRCLAAWAVASIPKQQMWALTCAARCCENKFFACGVSSY